ncbi:hypothetical protein CEE37_12535 [candidate division LCP-89 bacterium B3_LCP]|uniref:Secretion system C-terminal sorting domain-containing protein n=1 Tax=candidate division LCP-89 bacterium B3_LCP TaxID=2012998 RepID=A0A532UUG3_UNCL8|nr:MAG: hypothetical protein CEE37_12535 [candidate division LCP-89 bacterium B3_LCP]
MRRDKMLKKTVWILLSFVLIFGGQVWGKAVSVDQTTIAYKAIPYNLLGQASSKIVINPTDADHDVSAQKFHVPMPTSAYFTEKTCTVEIHNLGLQDEGGVESWFAVDGAAVQLLPWDGILSGGMQEREHIWTIPAPGSYFMQAYTTLPTDEDSDNDTSKAGWVEVTDANTFEFGYDNRQYSWDFTNLSYLNFPLTTGAMIRFTPAADGVTIPLYAHYIRAMFAYDPPEVGEGVVKVHLYNAGTPTQPGAEIANWEAWVSTFFPEWQVFDISSYLQNTNGEFWVWLEVLDTSARIMGSSPMVHGEGHFFEGQTGFPPTTIVFDLFARAIFGDVPLGVEKPGSVSQPNVFALHQNAPNPFNPSTSITFMLEKAGMAKVSVFDPMGRQVAVLTDQSYIPGLHTINFDASSLSSGVYFYRLEANGRTVQKKMLFLK